MSIHVHHLRVGRSVFTVWLLEELGLEYTLQLYDRNRAGRAPPELKAPHPLGKSPVLEIDGFVLAETAAIAMYLIETRASDGPFAPPPAGPERGRWLQWLHYPEGSVFAPLLMTLLLVREAEPKPPVVSAFAAGEIKLHLDYIDAQLGDNPFIFGESMSLPDFGITYVLSVADRLRQLGPYPRLKAYVDRNMARPAFRRAYEKTGG